ncbi:hypothetical protein Tsubulata_027599, partial [Turnera subulata]
YTANNLPVLSPPRNSSSSVQLINPPSPNQYKSPPGTQIAEPLTSPSPPPRFPPPRKGFSQPPPTPNLFRVRLMASVSSQPQFRLTQPPSKVLHLRNLPWECTEEELIELGKPFGRVVNTKCNVGANKNQAFIEFEDQNQAIKMITYYATSSEAAQVRGKTVYLQYSNRQEIVNNKTTADVAGNVLLVTIEGPDARLVSIDILHLVSKQIGCLNVYG